MIRKLCAFLLVVIVLMVVAKTAFTLRGSRSHAPSAIQTAQAETETIAPVVYYTSWVPYAIENELTNRNGYLLDLVRAVFPRARFVRLYGDTSVVAEVLEKDPLGVSIMQGDHYTLAKFPGAPKPVLVDNVVVHTMRTNSWNYTGPKSLEKLRLVFQDDYLICKELDKHAKANPDNVHVCKTEDPAYGDVAGEVIAGRADGFVSTKALQSDSRSIGFTAGKMLVLRASKPIGTVEIFFKVSNRDPKLAGTILEAWERGLKRIEKSGELARLRDYYGITEAKTLSASKSVE